MSADKIEATRFVDTVVVIDPDSRGKVTLEVRKCLESGAMVGIDASYLDAEIDAVRNPYNDGLLDYDDGPNGTSDTADDSKPLVSLGDLLQRCDINDSKAGWLLSEREGLFDIQKDDELGLLNSDEAAVQYVTQAAAAPDRTNPHLILALYLHGQRAAPTVLIPRWLHVAVSAVGACQRS